MYESFIDANNLEKIVVQRDENIISNEAIRTLFVECGGSNFRNGLYKIHTPKTSIHWGALIRNAYPLYEASVIPFAYDWMGRQFAVDYRRGDVIQVFDSATVEYFEIYKNLVTFHNELLVSEREDVLSETLFSNLMAHLKRNKLNYDECICHKKPLFLGGTDDPDNFEVSNIEVYWDFQHQIFDQIKNLHPGTKINAIKWQPK